MIRPVYRLVRPTLSLPRRSIHSASATFITADQESAVSIQIGEAHEAYVLIPPHVGNAISAACQQEKSGIRPTRPLIFNHVTRSFTCKSTISPRLVIPQDLPVQSDASTSPATLYLFGVAHTIALDGTPDAEFAKQSCDSWHELRPVLDKLEDM